MDVFYPHPTSVYLLPFSTRIVLASIKQQKAIEAALSVLSYFCTDLLVIKILHPTYGGKTSSLWHMLFSSICMLPFILCDVSTVLTNAERPFDFLYLMKYEGICVEWFCPRKAECFPMFSLPVWHLVKIYRFYSSELVFCMLGERLELPSSLFSPPFK